MTTRNLIRAVSVVVVLSAFPLTLMVAARLFVLGMNLSLIVVFLLVVFVSLMIWAVEIDRIRLSDRQEK